LPNHKEREEFGQRKVVDVMQIDADTLPAQMSVHEAVERVSSSQFRAWPVLDEGSIVGVLSLATLQSALDNGRTEQKLIDLFETIEFPHCHKDHALHQALERMSNARVDMLPVVDRADIHKLEGIVTLRDVLDSYGVDSIGSA
jgi:CIC family chloride channel protein